MSVLHDDIALKRLLCEHVCAPLRREAAGTSLGPFKGNEDKMDEQEDTGMCDTEKVPGVVQDEAEGQAEKLQKAHCAGSCTPCFFFTRKSDGCRQGEACSYCHICSGEEATRRRNARTWQRRKERRRACAGMMGVAQVH